MNWIIFEDEQVEQLYPMILARPAYAISCGSFRLADWLAELPGPKHGVIRPYLADLQRIDFEELSSDPPAASEPLILVNARLAPEERTLRVLQRFAQQSGSAAIWNDQEIAAVRLESPAAELVCADRDQLCEQLQSAEIAALPRIEEPLTLFHYPHDVIDANQKILSSNLEYRLKNYEYREVNPGVFVAEGAQLGDYVSTNTKAGPILLEANASVGPFSYLSGPGHVGRNTRLIEHAAIKDACSIGHTVKIGGEVEASIIEPYTNKQHYGFLGHSYLGSWINLGAGTCNSDLKNTYGPINMEYPSGRVATGRQFVGCIMGDYSKTAINTGIFTGKIIGACSMLYGFVTTNVPSFVTYARLFGQVTEIPPEVMIATQKRMFQRRNVTQRPCDIELIRDMYQLTRAERQATGDQLSL